MTIERWFVLANALALPGWFALLLAPLHRAAMRRIARAVGVLLAVGYLTVFVFVIGAVDPPTPGDGIAAITRFFADPRLALLGWVHYLAFDLWVGAWEVDVAGRERVPHVLVVPALVLTFLLGPIGLLAFLAVRAVVAWRGRA